MKDGRHPDERAWLNKTMTAHLKAAGWRYDGQWLTPGPVQERMRFHTITAAYHALTGKYHPAIPDPKPWEDDKRTSYVFLVGCGRRKRDCVARAEDFYIGDLFMKARAVAERYGRFWAILSAKHGLVMPDQVLRPYNAVLRTRPQAFRWGNEVNRHLRECFAPGTHFVVLAGALYRLALHDRAGLEPLSWEAPLTGLGIGSQLGHLKAVLDGRRPLVLTGPSQAHLDLALSPSPTNS